MAVCSKCGGSNVEFKRERSGYISQSNYVSSGRSNLFGVRAKGVGAGTAIHSSVAQKNTESTYGYKTVGFCKSCGNTWVIQDDLKDGSKVKGKKRTWLLLCGLGGFFGLHRFYNGEFGKGMLYLCTMGLFMIGWIRDFFIILGTPSENFKG